MSVDRYVRQRILPEIGESGQRRLADSHAVVVGCGALGSVQAQLLARAGVGRLTVIDRDFVERANLQRQILFTDADADAATPKAVAAERALSAINPEIVVRGVVDDLRAGTAEDLLSGADRTRIAARSADHRRVRADDARRHRRRHLHLSAGLGRRVPRRAPCTGRWSARRGW